MAFLQHRQTDAYITASAIADQRPVTPVSSVANMVILAATTTMRPLGITDASQAQGMAVTIYEHSSIAKAIAAASVGMNTIVGVGSTNGALGPVVGASGIAVWSVGETRNAAAAGEALSVYVNPRQLSGLI
jgi:hypothetical protein